MWSRVSVPPLAKVVKRLRRLLEEHMASAQRRTRGITSDRAIQRGAWTADVVEVCTVEDFTAHAVALSHPKDGFAVLIFPNASGEHQGPFST